MKTYFASPERSTEQELQEDIDLVSHNPIIDGLLETVSGMLAVLNEHRQIISLNNTLLNMLGIENPGEVFGLRPGEALQCIHAHETEGGCGTSRYCSTCGAAISIVSSLSSHKEVERKCIATIRKENATVDLCLSVRACPVNINGHTYVLLFLQDITAHEEKAFLEQTFYHDISNLITGLVGVSEMIETAEETEVKEYYRYIKNLTFRLEREVMIQKAIATSDTSRYVPAIDLISLSEIVEELEKIFSKHSVAIDKELILPEVKPETYVHTDPALLIRILTNMLKNAFEATDKGGQVRFEIDASDAAIIFSVWNDAYIPENVSLRIFQRLFSTKDSPGRGLGTYTMKLLGEHILHGKVDFRTSEAEGTTFSYTLNKEPH